MARELVVWLRGERVGELSQVEGRLSFVYAAEWLKPGPGVHPPLSQSLPLRAEAFDDRASRPFFAGLLPEGEKRLLVAQALQASQRNDFALLDGIGGECAGAVSLWPPGHDPAAVVGGQGVDSATVRWVDEPELQAMLTRLPRRPMLAGDDGLRLSLAGAQDKLPVVVDETQTRIGLPLHGAPSSHILKPPIPGIEGSVLNEAFCMRLAARAGMDVAGVAVRQVDGRAVLLVARYDRRVEGDGRQLTRLHQEDFCQALAVPPEHKYQNEGGPDLAQLFALVRQATRPNAPQVLRLLDAVIFNALVGNHDAHGKNFSLLYGPQGARLAPLYDLLCTAVYPELSEKMAMKIGSKYRFADVMPRHWEQFSKEAGLPPAAVRRRVLEMAKRLPDWALETLDDMNRQGEGHDVLGHIVALIRDRCALTVQRFATPSRAGAQVGSA